MSDQPRETPICGMCADRGEIPMWVEGAGIEMVPCLDCYPDAGPFAVLVSGQHGTAAVDDEPY